MIRLTLEHFRNKIKIAYVGNEITFF
jgi:hypothetical protein